MNRRPPRPTLGMDGAGVLIIVGALLAGAATIWAIVEGWPLLLLVGGLAIATKTAKRHRQVFKGSTIAASVLLFAVLVVHAIVNPTPTAPVAAASPPPSVASAAPFAPAW